MNEMTLWEHFGELRKRLLLSFIAIAIFSILCYTYWDILLYLLKKPTGGQNFVYLSYMEPFVARFKLALWGGFLLSFPFVLYQVMAFIVPGLKKSEKRFLVLAAFLMVLLFYSGIYFGYRFVLSVGIKWLESQGAGLLTPNLTISQFISFVGLFLLAFGACFETPLVVVILARIGAVRPIQLIKQWRMAIVIILVVSAVVTPDWSPVTMGLMAVPMLALYILGVILAFIFAPRKRKKIHATAT